MATTPDTVEPLAGDVSETVGGVVSGGGACTVTETLEALESPAPLNACRGSCGSPG